MKTEIKKLVINLENCFKGKPWYGYSVLHKLNEIEFNLVNESPLENTNTIAKIVQHMINWRIFAIEKIKGNEEFDIKLNTSDDWPETTVNSEKEWLHLINILNDTQEELIELLQSNDDEFLKWQTPGREYDYKFLVEGIIQHDIYHLGQIAIVAKQAKIKVNLMN
ncbi:MAG: DinB family protein [Leeuwenhoekiella sp.]